MIIINFLVVVKVEGSGGGLLRLYFTFVKSVDVKSKPQNDTYNHLLFNINKNFLTKNKLTHKIYEKIGVAFVVLSFHTTSKYLHFVAF
jgi:hypothetical protein